eukprot:87940-Chlamydomonas_euryale.AAC.1
MAAEILQLGASGAVGRSRWLAGQAVEHGWRCLAKETARQLGHRGGQAVGTQGQSDAIRTIWQQGTGRTGLLP